MLTLPVDLQIDLTTSDTKRLALADSKAFEDGVYLLTYRPSQNGAASTN